MTTTRLLSIVFRARKIIAMAVILELLYNRANKVKMRRNKNQSLGTQAQDVLQMMSRQMSEYASSIRKHAR